MKNPLVTFWHTVSDIKIYQQLITQPLRVSFKYFVTVYGLVSVGLGLVIAATVIPDVTNQFSQVVQSVKTHYPDTAVLTFQNGALTVTGAVQPVYLPLPAPLPDSRINNFLILNTATPAADIAGQSTLYLATKNSLALITNPQTHEYQLIDWPNMPDPLTLTAQSLKEDLTTLQSTISTLASWRFLLLPLATFLISITSRLLFAALYTFPLTLVGLAIGRPYRYRRLLGVSLHTIILADVINFLAGVIYQSPLPSLFTIAFLGISMLVLVSLPAKKPTEPPAI